MEMDFMEYVIHINELLKEETIKSTSRNIKNLGKFNMTPEGNWEAVQYAGYTMITPTYENDFKNYKTYKHLEKIKLMLLKTLDMTKIVQAPTNALHMTVARLISGNAFGDIVDKSLENDFLKTFDRLFSKGNIQAPIRFKVEGLTVFQQGVIAAVVSPLYEDDYLRLQAFRDYIYNSRELIDMGVERKRGFIGHISLFYIEGFFTKEDGDKLSEEILKINKGFRGKSFPFEISYAEIRKFDNYNEFYRKNNWPVYIFD